MFTVPVEGVDHSWLLLITDMIFFFFFLRQMKIAKCGTFRPFLEIDRKVGIEETGRVKKSLLGVWSGIVVS